MTDVKQELPRCLYVAFGFGGFRPARPSDLLALLPLLEPEQQWAIEESLHLAGADIRTRLRKQAIAAEAERDAAIKRAEEIDAEFRAAKHANIGWERDNADLRAENEKLRGELVALRGDNGRLSEKYDDLAAEHEAQLATIAEKAAREQRARCAEHYREEWKHSPTHGQFGAMTIERSALVTDAPSKAGRKQCQWGDCDEVCPDHSPMTSEETLVLWEGKP